MVQIDVSAQDAVGNKALRSTRAVLIPGGRPPLAPTASAPPSPLASSPARQKRATVARRGLLVSGTGSGAVRVSVRVSAALARSLGATSRTIAVRNVTGLGGHFRELVKFGSRVRRAIRHRSRTTVTVSVSGGATATKTIAIVR